MFEGMFWTWLDWKARESGVGDWQMAYLIWLHRIKFKGWRIPYLLPAKPDKTIEDILEEVRNWSPHPKQRRQEKRDFYARLYGGNPPRHDKE